MNSGVKNNWLLWPLMISLSCDSSCAIRELMLVLVGFIRTSPFSAVLALFILSFPFISIRLSHPTISIHSRMGAALEGVASNTDHGEEEQ